MRMWLALKSATTITLPPLKCLEWILAESVTTQSPCVSVEVPRSGCYLCKTMYHIYRVKSSSWYTLFSMAEAGKTKERIAEIEALMERADFWTDSAKAQQLIK